MQQSRTQSTFVSPIVESSNWIRGRDFPAEQPLLNLSQAAPTDPPPAALRDAMASAALQDDSVHLYGAVLGRSELRDALAVQTCVHYDADVTSNEIGITSGCNQAFAATIASLCGEGDEVILPTPWYFNHKMYLDMAGVKTIPLPVGAQMMPSVTEAATKITSRTRAIVLITPNNPCGVEYPEGLLKAFYDLAVAHNLVLIVDETYRDFDSRTGAPHQLFSEPNWQKHFVQLYSFSKAYRLTGHRVGAIIAGQDRLAEIEKFLDTMTICPNQLGQVAAHWGIKHLQDWLAGERDEILRRRQAIADGFGQIAQKGWKLLGLGAYFAYVEHPYTQSSTVLARQFVEQSSLLMLPGTMFCPADDPAGARQFRIAFANADSAGIAQLFDRIAAFTPEK
ncbi:hypothetical protein SAMN04488118_10391 [Epibacterium ulvae]|uniref:aspartate transaminase n=1 Tax=Epibacterium ulvae TaxID=1156985 RepID=A0A1G5Q7T6_9RHOB|nr:aminotransferase [Epibacterium ulvae]SCZ57520.1 hypothetical protein SAMN04488118_10391 [Epibacterium ulvae]